MSNFSRNNRKMVPFRAQLLLACREHRQSFGLATAALLAVFSGTVCAANITVNSLLDNSNGSDALCTLREAVLAADLNIPIDTCVAGSASNADVIALSATLFPPPLRTGIINLTNSLNVIDTSLSIQIPANAGLTMIGDGLHPVLTLDQNAGASFSLNNTLLRDGFNAQSGGGIAIQGGTRTVTLTGVHVIENDSLASGGGIGSTSTNPLTLNLIDSAISNNSAGEDGGGIAMPAFAQIDLSLVDTDIRNNAALGSGGGIHMAIPSTVGVNATVTIRQGRISGNAAVINGGGILLSRGNNAGSRLTAEITDSSFVDNQATGASASGGGLVAQGLRFDALSSIVLRRNTFVNNTASNSAGGLFISALGAVMTNNSIIGNTGGRSGGAELSYFSAEAPFSMAVIGNTFHYNTGGAATASSAGWDLSVTYPAVAGSAIRYVGNAINNDVTSASDAPCKFTPLPPGVSFIGGFNMIRDTLSAMNCIELASDLVLPDLKLTLSGVIDPNHDVAVVPQIGSPVIDAWPDGNCQFETGIALDVHMLGARRIGGVPINGDPYTPPACDSGAIEAPTGRLLTVALAGSGSGSVSSVPGSIDCGVNCNAVYPEGTSVTLSTIAGSNSVFSGWTGACSGTGSCVILMNQAQSVTATFEPIIDPIFSDDFE